MKIEKFNEQIEDEDYTKILNILYDFRVDISKDEYFDTEFGIREENFKELAGELLKLFKK